jgi:hypothetical protein
MSATLPESWLDRNRRSGYTDGVSTQNADPSARAGELAEHELENALRETEGCPEEEPAHPVFAVIPEQIISASPEEFSAFLECALSDGADLDEALDRSLTPSSERRPASGHNLRAVVPVEALDHRLPQHFIDQVFIAFEEIDSVLSELHDQHPDIDGQGPGHAVAVVPDDVIGDPEQVLRAIDRVQDEAEKLRLLVRQARHSLRRLNGYRLSRKPPGRLIGEMRKAQHLRTLQYVVEFLRSVHTAAESFERLELPRPHIRDYLEHLYRMEDWDALSALVRRLERAVVRYLRDEARRANDSPGDPEPCEEPLRLELDVE